MDCLHSLSENPIQQNFINSKEATWVVFNSVEMRFEGRVVASCFNFIEDHLEFFLLIFQHDAITSQMPFILMYTWMCSKDFPGNKFSFMKENEK